MCDWTCALGLLLQFAPHAYTAGLFAQRRWFSTTTTHLCRPTAAMRCWYAGRSGQYGVATTSSYCECRLRSSALPARTRR